MKKVDMIKKLEEEGFDAPDMKWGAFQKYYREKMDIVADRMKLSKPTLESVNEDIDRNIETGKVTKTKLQITREELYPEIVEIMIKLKGRSRATHDEIREMVRLYNAFYLRNDSPSCGACISRVWRSFTEICKGRI